MKEQRRREMRRTRAALLAAIAGVASLGAAKSADRHVLQSIVAFRDSPFPFSGLVPGATPSDASRPFLQSDPDGRRFHLAPRGGKLYEIPTYSDRRSLLAIPPQFDPERADARLVVFFHGNLATLTDVSERQRVPAQLAASHLNAALIAPQLAVDALDSSAGRFYDPGFFEIYLHEAAQHLATLSQGRFTADDIDRLPVILVAYSGGYVPTAYTLATDDRRVAGVVLLDALFGEEAKFAAWIERHSARCVFVSAYSKASAPLNATLQADLQTAGIPIETALPERIEPGTVVLRAAPDAAHNDFVTKAWIADPLAAILARMRDAAR